MGYENLQLTPHRDFIPFYNHPRADDDLVAKLRKACADAGVGIASVLPVLRWSGPDEDAREAAVRNWKRGLEAVRIIRGVNAPNLGMVYVACHTFHMGGTMGSNTIDIIRAAGDRLRLVHVADTMDHHRSHGLRYIINPPGNAARVHQHLKIGDGDVDWDEFFSGLAEIGCYDRPDTVMVSSVFSEDEDAHEVSRYQLATMTDYVAKYTK